MWVTLTNVLKIDLKCPEKYIKIYLFDNNFPNCDVIMCWNHLINDFKFNLQKMGADHTNIAVYVTNIKELPRCNSEEEYNEKKTVLTSKWSKPIVSYFQKLEKEY